MSGLGSFIGGFASGYGIMKQIEGQKEQRELEKKRQAREDERWKAEKEQMDRERKYRDDLAAAGQTMVTGTSGVPGVSQGGQQDAQLARQNAEFASGSGQVGISPRTTVEDTPPPATSVQQAAQPTAPGAQPANQGATPTFDATSFTNQPVSQGEAMGLIRKAAMANGRPEDAMRFQQMEAASASSERQAKFRDSNQRIMADYQAGKADLNGTLIALSHNAAAWGDDPLGSMLRNKQFQDEMEREGHGKAMSLWMQGAPAEQIVARFNGQGVKAKEAHFEDQVSPITGQKEQVIVATLENGQPFRIGYSQAMLMTAGDKDVVDTYNKMRDQANQDRDAADKAAKAPLERRRLESEIAENNAQAGYYRSGGGRSASGGGGGPKAVATMEWKSAAYQKIGISPELSDAIAANPSFATTPAAVQKQAQFIMKNSLTPISPGDAMNQARQSMAAAQSIAFGSMGADESTPGLSRKATSTTLKDAVSYLKGAKGDPNKLKRRVKALAAQGWTDDQIRNAYSSMGK